VAKHGLKRTVLSDQVRAYIIEAILNGEFESGDRVVESALARELGVSQAPVREAIRDLTFLGFLETENYKGASVRSFSPEELYEVYTVRAALEALAARLATTRATRTDLDNLRDTLDEMIEAGRKRDLDLMTKLDNDFHQAILEISGNKLLYQLWKRLQFGYWTIVTARMSTFDLEYLASRHAELLQAIASGDPQQATEAMRRHIEDLGKPPENFGAEHE
jgi:DNA-binding GntR family transcriptional regulator